MNAKHTPGPWHLGKEGYYFQSVRDQNEHITADVNITRSDGEGGANARLIAAAPDLLAALEIAEGRLMCIDAQKLDTVARNDDVIDRIRAAIARARGE
jgi:hypothetical protein